jgi:hypothetical protein
MLDPTRYFAQFRTDTLLQQHSSLPVPPSPGHLTLVMGRRSMSTGGRVETE